MNYQFDEFGRYAGTSADPTDRSTPLAPPELSAQYVWNFVQWVHAPDVLVSPVAPGEPPSASAPAVTPPQFKLLFTPPERIALQRLRASTDPAQQQVREALDDFFSILDDARLTEVDLALASTQAAVEQVLTVLQGADVVTDVAARKAAILSGVVL